MYTSPSGLVLGFHGCDKSVADKVLSGKTRLTSSTNSYDWIGNGIYFWENNPARALEYAKVIMKYPERVRNPIKEPAFSSVRAMFTEGKDVYNGAGFKEKNHIQICVKNPNCIKGYFRVLEPIKGHSIP